MPLLTTGAGKFPSAAGGASSHAYWRMEFDGVVDNNGAKLMHFNEAEMLVGGVDQTTGGTATASSELSGSFVAANAFDNNSGTEWASDNSDTWPQWLQYQFASPVLPDAISITPNVAARSPENITVKSSDDGSSFTVYATVNTGALAAWADGTKRTFSIP